MRLHTMWWTNKRASGASRRLDFGRFNLQRRPFSWEWLVTSHEACDNREYNLKHSPLWIDGRLTGTIIIIEDILCRVKKKHSLWAFIDQRNERGRSVDCHQAGEKKKRKTQTQKEQGRGGKDSQSR